ncbi:MAG: hypothetical protein ACXV39_11495 [Halobacteriota archaeon]
MELVLGHNQFIGISHISEERGREREKKFSKVENIYRVVEAASAVGVKNMIIETHPRMLNFVKYYEQNKTFDMEFYLQVPYVAAYVGVINQRGMRGFLSEMIHRAGFGGTSSLALKGAFNLLKKDYLSIALSYLKLEVAPFSSFNVKGLILHNTLTDLLMALEVQSVCSAFERYVNDTLKLEFGLATWNFALVKRNLERWNIRPAFVMTPLNVKGFDMNPTQEDVEAGLREYDGAVFAMNVLGGGAFSIAEAASYVKSFDTVKKCVVGASSKEHLTELVQTFQL